MASASLAGVGERTASSIPPQAMCWPICRWPTRKIWTPPWQRLNAASAVTAGAAQLLDDATFDGDAVRRLVVPLLGDHARIDRMTVRPRAQAAQHKVHRVGV